MNDRILFLLPIIFITILLLLLIIENIFLIKKQ